jgi:succinate dehydrogenase/fumarate reductase flavoprotein subunit
MVVPKHGGNRPGTAPLSDVPTEGRVMAREPGMVSLGFTKQVFPAGVHVCQVFGNDHERLDSLLKFLQSGLLAGERAACFTDDLDETLLDECLAASGLSCDACKASGAFSGARASDVYFEEGRFDPDRLLERLRRYHQESVADGFPAARVIGEMTADVLHTPGGSRLMEYESRVSLLLRDHPVTAICQYDANSFDGATIMRVLKVHPLMVVRGNVVHNPFYVSPEEYLARHC